MVKAKCRGGIRIKISRYYPFIPDMAIPFEKDFRKKKNKIRIVTVNSTAPAVWIPGYELYSPFVNKPNNALKGIKSYSLVIIIYHKNSSQVLMNVKMATIAVTDLDKGSITEKTILSSEQPSILAASISSCGIVL